MAVERLLEIISEASRFVPPDEKAQQPNINWRRLADLGNWLRHVTQTALAADPKPDATIKNKNIEASVYLDDKIKADPALAADCLAEGKKWIDKNAAEAAASRKTDPQMFRNGVWTTERKYETRSVVDGHYISIVRSDYTDTGGAHPNGMSTPSCGIRTQRSASASGRSLPRRPIAARP